MIINARPTIALLMSIATAFSPAFAETSQQTEVSYRVGEKFSSPSIDRELHRDIFSVIHVRRYQSGEDFLNIDHIKSDRHEPTQSGQGATETYMVYNHQWYLSPLTGKDLSFGPVKEVALSTGVDWNTKNTRMQPHVFKMMIGPTFKLNVPKGFFDASLLYYQEHNHNGIVEKAVHYEPTYRISFAWGLPLGALAKTNFSVNGFLNYTGAKGKDGFGVYTVPETWSNVYLMADISSTLNTEPNTVKLGMGYEYVRNKLGNPPTIRGGGTNTATPMLKLAIGF